MESGIIESEKRYPEPISIRTSLFFIRCRVKSPPAVFSSPYPFGCNHLSDKLLS